MTEQITRCTITGCGKRDADGNRVPRVTESGYACDRCTERFLEHLSDIVELYALLPDMIDPDTRSKTYGPRVSGTPVTPANARLDVIALLDPRSKEWSEHFRRDGRGMEPDDAMDILGRLESWARMIREEKRITPPDFGATISSEATVIRSHALWCAEQSWVGEMHQEIRECWQALRQATGHGPDPILGYCWNDIEGATCDGAIRQVPGELALQCGRCRSVWQTAQEIARANRILRHAG